uniref:Uncharacterized protein n=1 Tax=Quercus lobata TaxID=97700 RepID=A0A7N2KU22_QUELO
MSLSSRNDDEPAEDAEIDSHNNFSNPIGQPRGGVPRQVPSPPRGEPKWESNFKIELPKFYGSLNHEEFMDWFNQVERIFDFHEVPDSKKVEYKGNLESCTVVLNVVSLERTE